MATRYNSFVNLIWYYFLENMNGDSPTKTHKIGDSYLFKTVQATDFYISVFQSPNKSLPTDYSQQTAVCYNGTAVCYNGIAATIDW